MSLRDFTQDLHQEAEKTWMAKELMSGSIDPGLYFKYLQNIYFIHRTIERCCEDQNLLKGIENICNSERIFNDLTELSMLYGVNYEKLLPVTIDYVSYLGTLKEEVLAHLYVRHFGDMYGGQMIKKKIPGSGTMYDFKAKKTTIDKTRKKLSDDLGPEARKAFQYAIDLMKGLESEYNI